MTICDLRNDNYHNLIAAEIPFELDKRPRLKVYKGTQLISEQGLPGIPSSIQTVYIDEPDPKMPSVFFLFLTIFKIIEVKFILKFFSYCDCRWTIDTVLS